MNRTATLLAMLLMITTMATGSALARGAGGHFRPRPHGDSVGVTPHVVSDPQNPIEWLTDYEAACKLAADKDRALLILVTTDEAERSARVCTFASNDVRRAVRDAEVVPLKLRPPVMLDTAKLPPEEAKQRQELFKQAQERYEALVRGFGVSTVPSLVYAAPDAVKLVMQAAPSDQDIFAALARLPEMVAAHEDAVAKAGGGEKAGQPGGEPPKKADPGPKETKPAEAPKPPAPKDPDGGVDDF